MLTYIITIFGYLISFDFVYLFTGDLTLSLISKILVTAGLLYYFRKDFDFCVKFDFLSVIIGVLIAVIWIGIDPFYSHLVHAEPYPYTLIDIILKLMIGVVLAPVVEEFFTRFFLLRYIIDKDWKAVKLGKFTPLSFIFTVLFFGISHSRWLAGLITGILLNLLFYKKKNIESVILAHAVANLVLGIYVIYTGDFTFW